VFFGVIENLSIAFDMLQNQFADFKESTASRQPEMELKRAKIASVYLATVQVSSETVVPADQTLFYRQFGLNHWKRLKLNESFSLEKNYLDENCLNKNSTPQVFKRSTE